MNNIKLPFVILLAGCLVLPPWWSRAQQPRGQGVRIRVENGQELDLYDESHALVIGVSDYTNGWRKLPGVKRDVADVAAVLERQGFKVTRLLDPAIEDFESAMRKFIGAAGLRERNRLVIYFAGHGHTERLSDERDLGYIVMRNAPKPDLDPAQFSQAAISMEQVNAWAQRIKSKHALFVFDSCFSGSIFRNESEKRRPARIESKSAGPVRQFITSGNAGQEVPDDSIFRRYFVRAFDGEGDLDGDGYLTGEELGIFLSGRVASDTSDTQTPRYGKIRDARLNLGDFVFALPKKAAPVLPPAPTPVPVFDPAAVELALWQSAQRNDEISDYEEYLRQYPQGRFAVSARNRLARLRAPVVNPPSANPAPVVTALTPLIALPAKVNPAALSVLTFTTATVDENGTVRRFAGTPRQQYVEDLGGGVLLEMAPVKRAGGDFWIGKFEVTQAQWRAVMGNDPSRFKGDKLPVENVCWGGSDCAKEFSVEEFIKRLNAKLGLSGANVYRLPKEAEWEYAARAGTKTEFAFGDTINAKIVNYNGKYPYGKAPNGVYREKTVEVGSLGVANAWGIFDMHGNVWEWCEDISSGSDRVYRGGGWSYSAVGCRSAYRFADAPGNRIGSVGFRLVRT